MNNYEFIISPQMRKEINMSIRAGLQQDLYPNLIVYFIRQRYTINDEFALARQKDIKLIEWEEYNNYCEACKAYAKELLNVH